MTNEHMTNEQQQQSNSKYSNHIGRLLDESMTIVGRQQACGAKLAVALYNATIDDEIDGDVAAEYAAGMEKKLAEACINDLCELYSSKYRMAEAVASDKTAAKDARDRGRRDMRACKQMMRRGLMICAYLITINPERVSVKGSDISIRHDDDDVDGRYPISALESRARKQFGRQGETGNNRGTSAKGVSLRIAANMVAEQVTGRGADEFEASSREALLAALVALSHAFAPAGDSIDAQKLREIYNKTAA